MRPHQTLKPSSLMSVATPQIAFTFASPSRRWMPMLHTAMMCFAGCLPYSRLRRHRRPHALPALLARPCLPDKPPPISPARSCRRFARRGRQPSAAHAALRLCRDKRRPLSRRCAAASTVRDAWLQCRRCTYSRPGSDVNACDGFDAEQDTTLTVPAGNLTRWPPQRPHQPRSSRTADGALQCSSWAL